MKTLAAVVIMCISLVSGGCGIQKPMAPMDSKMDSMEKPMETTMQKDTMMKDTETDPMKPEMTTMEKKTMQ